jgi:hypothetical protein
MFAAFQLVKPFFANLHYTISKNIHKKMFPMTPKIFNSFFAYENVHPEKVICKKILQVTSSIEENKLLFCTLLLSITYLLANVSHLSQQFRNQRKILRSFDTHIQIL